MLPVTTPPNNIIFGSGAIKIRQMLRAGTVLDIIGIVVFSLAILTLGNWVRGLGEPGMSQEGIRSSSACP